MATSTAERRAKREKANKTRAPQPVIGPRGADDIDLDEDIAAFLLRQVGGPRTTIDVAGRIVSGELERTMDGASTLSVTFHDATRTVLRSGVFGKDSVPTVGRFKSITAERKGYDRLAAVDVTLDGVSFRLVQMQLNGDDLVLTFEDREVSFLRQHRRTERASRAKVTRAQFVHTIVRKVQAGGGVQFKSPDENVKQPVAKAAKAKTKTDRDSDKEPGLSNGARVTVKGDRATASQQRVIDEILAVGHSAGATDRVLQTAVMVATQESNLDASARNGTHVGVFQQDQQPGSTWRQLGGATGNVRKDAAAFFDRAIKANADTKGALSLPELGARVQGYPPGVKEYAPHKDEAAKTVDSFTGGSAASGTLDSGTRERTYARSYQFTVSQPGQPETYWDAIQRLAGEVQWRAFMDRGTLWFASDETLMRQRPRMTIREPREGTSERDTRGIDRIEFDWDRGKPVIEATVYARTGRWQAPPGCVVEIIDSGPADGRWLVWNISRSLFDRQATITLRRPHLPVSEPAHEIAASSSGAGGEFATASSEGGGTTHVGKAFAAAQSIESKKYPYQWGGGHGSIGVPSMGSGGGPHRGDGPGFDCSGAVSAVLHEAGVLDTPLTSGGFMSYGDPGKGKYLTIAANSEHVFLIFTDESGKDYYWGTSTSNPNGGAGFHPARSTAGFTLRHPSGM